MAIGDDLGEHWFLIGASPDIRAQLEMLPRPSSGPARGSVVAGVLLPSADLDQVLGLFMLREGSPIRIFATPVVRQAVCEGLNVGAVLGEYSGVEWSDLTTDRPIELADPEGRPIGISCRAFAVPGKPPRYRERRVGPDPLDAVGFRFVDGRTGDRLVVATGLGGLDGSVIGLLGDSDVMLADGTFWSERELEEVRGGPSPTASAMGHLSVDGAGGSLARLGKLKVGRKVYIHVNNTNPMLLDDSPERWRVEAAGFEVGRDGLEFSV